MNLVTLVRADGLSAGTLSRASDVLSSLGEPQAPAWIEQGIAADIGFTGDRTAARVALEAAIDDADLIVQAAEGRAKRLLIADMDSTMITVECIDELADYAGIKAQVAEVTEAAMRGELDFVAALDARVALLKGLPSSTIELCHAERVKLMPGARQLVQTMRAHGAYAVLVSGGFTLFADRVAQAIGFHRAIANTLELAGDTLAGTVARPVVDSATKLETLRAEAAAHRLTLNDCLAVGDGANDIPMIEAAGLGVAYHAKPRTMAAADAAVRFGDLSALLYAQGYPRVAWSD